MIGRLLRDVRDSFFRIGWPKDERSANKAMVSSLVLHLQPAKVRTASLHFRATWAAGFVSLVLLVSLIITGVYLMFYYYPHPDVAYRSMKDLAFVVPFGMLTRNLHRWGAHAMVAIVTVHMARVFLSGGYKPPREANWVAGVLLWVLTLALSFTGYLLPWDQLAFWAVTVGANMVGAIPAVGHYFRELLLGDRVVGEAALLRFYVLHCVVLPLAIVGIGSFHIYRVRRDGGLVTTELAATSGPTPASTSSPPPRMSSNPPRTSSNPPGEGHDAAPRVPAWPYLLYRELAVTLVTTAALLALSLWVNAPLEPEADPTRTPNPAKAPWYFLGVQELAHYSAFWGGVFVPAMTVLVLCAVPYFDRSPAGKGRYFARERRFASAAFMLLMALMTVFTVVGTYFRGPAWALMFWPY